MAEEKKRSEQAKLLEDAREASLKAHVENLRILHRLKESSASDCGTSAPCGPAESPGDKLSAIGDLAFDLARFHITSYNNLLDLSAEHTDRVIDDLRRLFRRRRAGALHVRPALHVKVVADEPAEDVKFEVENRYDVAIELGFSVSEFLPVKDGKPVSAAVEFAADPPVPEPPGERHLKPGERRTFQMKFTPCVPPFATGTEYRVSVYIAIDACVLEELPLRVTVTKKPESRR
jgi:hypothetical protein